MRNVRRWLYSAGTLTAAGATACGLGLAGGPGSASAASAASSHPRFTTEVVTTSVSHAAAYVPPNHNLYYGAHGPAVRSVQRRLNQLHYYAGPVDGQFGQDLAWAVWAFKRVQGLPVVNKVDSNTANTAITLSFRKALAHPKQPYALVPKGGANRVEINLKRQYLVLYKNGAVNLILDISSGGGYYYCNPKPPKGDGSCGTAVTEDGNFHAAYFVPGWDKVPLGYMYNPVFFNPAAGQAMHGGDPVPYFPASHGCVRLQEDVQNWFHNRLTVGGPHATPVYVRGVAPYAPASWF